MEFESGGWFGAYALIILIQPFSYRLAKQHILNMKFTFKIILYILFITSILVPGLSFSDVVFLKNGRQLTANKIWQQNGKVVCSIDGSTFFLDSEDVLKIKHTKNKTKKHNGNFSFDIWKSGMDIEEILFTAKRHDIPLHRNGLISANKKFNPNVSSKYAKTATRYYYKTKLLGRHATVNLYLTDLNKRLKMLSITWHNMKNKENSAGFEEEITEMLSAKYGKPKSNIPKIFERTKKWVPSPKMIIELKMFPSSYVLTYWDIAMVQLDKKEKRQKNKIRKQQYQLIDTSKF